MPVAEFRKPAHEPFSFEELKPKIMVVGVGGAGGNAVNNMIRSNLQGVEFWACNTDAQALSQSLAERRMQLGVKITQGLGAGSRPEVGRAAAEESMDHIIREMQSSNMVFITAGMGGGTGTGAAPVIAQASREQGILTVGVVTKPFHFEGKQRMIAAEKGIEELAQFVDTLIIIPNQNLFRVANEKTTFAQAFTMADNVLYSGVRGVTDLMLMPGLINLDFADIRSIMSEMGKAMMGTGEAEGEGRALAAAEAAISNPLLDDVSIKGAQGVLINITGGMDMMLFEVDEAANLIREQVNPDANIIFGSTFDETMTGDDKKKGKMRVSVVATGIDADSCRAYSLGAVFSKNNSSKHLGHDMMEAQDEPSLNEENFHEEHLMEGEGINSAEQPLGMESSQEEEFYDEEALNYASKKRGFLRRVADTLRGVRTEEESEREEYSPRPVMRPLSPESRQPKMSPVKEEIENLEDNLQDIPAYLRRNKR